MDRSSCCRHSFYTFSCFRILGLALQKAHVLREISSTNSLRATAMFNGTSSTSNVKACGLMLDVNDVCISTLFTKS